MFETSVCKCIHRDKVKLKGSLRTARLQKKQKKHFDKLYKKYRNEIFMKKYGVTFEDFKKKNAENRKNRQLHKFIVTRFMHKE